MLDTSKNRIRNRNHRGVRHVLFTLVLFFSFAPFAYAGDFDWVADILAAIVYPLALAIGGFFIGIGGLALDLTIQYLVVGMGTMLKGGIGIGITSIWEIVRDLFNIAFIFSFIFLGIKTILNAEDSNTRKGLINLIIAALFINFSLLIALVIIDFSNILATQIYQQILTSAGMTATSDSGILIRAGNNSLSGAFMEIGALNSFFAPDAVGNIKGMNLVVYSLLLMIFFIIAGIIFIFATYHLIRRFVTLCIYLVLSPVLFLGMILPNFKKFTDDWLKGLLKQSFFAPAFFFMLYMSLVSLSRLKEMFNGDPSKGYTTIFDGKDMTPDGFTIFLLFAIVIGFLYASVKVGDMMGIQGSKAAMGAIDKAQKMGRQFVGNATLGAGAGLLRATVGGAAQRYADSDALKEQASKRGWSGMMARNKLRASRVVGDASFDVRKVGGLGKNLGIGDGGKGGYKTRTEAIEKKEKEFAKSLGEVGDNDVALIGLNRDKQAVEEALKKAKEDRAGAVSEIDRRAAAVAVLKNEEELKAIEEKIKREKSRRQIGTDADVKKSEATRAQYAATQAELDNFHREYAEAKKAEDKEKMREISGKIKEVNEKRKDLARKAKEADGSLGYAGVLEKRGFWKSALLGRVVQQDHSAGEAIRKQYEKAVKKSKEDERTDALREEIAKGSSKDKEK